MSALIAAISARYPVADLTVADQEIEEVIRAIYLDLAGQANSVGNAVAERTRG